MADQFCLRWNNFQSNIVNALDSLKCSEDLVDVTLTCEGKNIKAHKVILSACSPYFRNVFKENPCQHPVIILKDVPADDIVSLLSYMYQGEVFIEESKLSSFLHTAALLQVKGLSGVTQARENFSSPTTSNKLYTQLTISPKSQVYNFQKLPGLKKRRSSTSDKPNDITIGSGQKKSKLIDTEMNNSNQTIKEMAVENVNVEKKTATKTEPKAVSNGKTSNQSPAANAQGENVPVMIKTECQEETGSPTPAASTAVTADNDEAEDDNVPDYENSMLARSLLSGINPLKHELNANNNNVKKVLPKFDARPKETNGEVPALNASARSPLKVLTNDDTLVKTEKHSPKSDMEYEPEVLLSEQQDCGDSEGAYAQEPSQALLFLAGMSNAGALGNASTSQGISHQQSNHAAICGDCPHCGMKYSNQSALKYHVRLMHSDLTNRLCCYLCPRSFTMRETFKEHMWSTHGQRN